MNCGCILDDVGNHRTQGMTINACARCCWPASAKKAQRCTLEIVEEAPASRVRIDVLTLFPEMFTGPIDVRHNSAAPQKQDLLDLRVHNLPRLHARQSTRRSMIGRSAAGRWIGLESRTDFEAVEAVAEADTKVILLTPSGRFVRPKRGRQLATEAKLLLICGAYERRGRAGVRTELADDVLSIGDYC